MTEKVPPIQSQQMETATIRKKRKRRDKSDLGPDFVAPDGGWGWVVCLAAGLSTFFVFPPIQQYGILYRQRMFDLGFNAKQITTIVNMEIATSTLIGIVNGAMFRRFTFRQVALTGGLLVFAGVSLTSLCTTFWQCLLCYSLTYGAGLGLNTSATALAVNTYFRNYRRRATGLTWTITGLGPILFPHVTTYLLKAYGVHGAILIIAALSLNTLVCGSTLQPVMWHVKPKKQEMKLAEKGIDNNAHVVSMPQLNNDDLETLHLCKYCKLKRNELENGDTAESPGYEMTIPGTPMLARANDGWFGSNVSLSSVRSRKQATVKGADGNTTVESREKEDELDPSELLKSNYFNQVHEDRLRCRSRSRTSLSDLNRCTCSEERVLLKEKPVEDHSGEGSELKEAEAAVEAEADVRQKMSFKEKVVKFFDLDLLSDLTFVNLVQGMTIMMFGEMNFAFLTPFILGSYGYNNEQISLAMSFMGGMDIVMRFIGPFLVEKMKVSNSALFAFGIIIISFGRLLVTMVADSYYVILGVFMLIGFGKAFRTIFAPLIIPSYVPLKRLPAASGLQLVFNTIICSSFGPLLGVIADATSYTVAIHFINMISCCSLLFWIAEYYIGRWMGKPVSHSQGA